MSNMADCVEDDCNEEAAKVCFHCSLFLCEKHAEDIADVCDMCGRPMERV